MVVKVVEIEGRKMLVNETTKCDTVAIDPMKEKIALLEQRIAQLEKTIERMDGLLQAINHRTNGVCWCSEL